MLAAPTIPVASAGEAGDADLAVQAAQRCKSGSAIHPPIQCSCSFLAEEARRQAGLAPDRAQRSFRDVVPIGSGHRHHPGPPIDASLEMAMAAALPGDFKTVPLQDTYDLADLHLRFRSSWIDRRAVCVLQPESASPATPGTTYDARFPGHDLHVSIRVNTRFSDVNRA